MNRYIDYVKFAEKHCRCGRFDGISEDELKKFIAPDVAHVVRCRDCKHMRYSEYYDMCCNRFAKHVPVSPDDYCSRGKHR